MKLWGFIKTVYKDRDGRKRKAAKWYIDFADHSQLRHRIPAFAAKVVQKLARHSDPRLTFNTCSRTFEKAEQKAMNFLPNFGDFVFATGLATNRKKQEISVYNHRHKNSQDTHRTRTWLLIAYPQGESNLNSQSSDGKGLSENSNSERVHNRVHNSKISPDLERIISVWPELPEHIKAAINALVQTYSKGVE